MSDDLTRREFIAGAAVAGAALAFPASARGRAHLATRPVVVATWKHGVAANEAAWSVLEGGGAALDAVEAGVRVSEADPAVTSVGYGGRPNAEGVVELDAAIMDGATRRAGSVAALRGFRHPVSVARRVMEKTPHVMLVGEGAHRFAASQGFAEDDLLTEESKAAFEEWKASRKGKTEGHDTIGMIALDAEGRLAVACTTSGLAWKLPGRVGDSPLIGAGLYADAGAGGATATGVGEQIIKVCGSFLVVQAMRRGESPQKACEDAVARILAGHPENRAKQVGFLALSTAGAIGAAGIRRGYQFAVRDGDGPRLMDAPCATEYR